MIGYSANICELYVPH